MVAPWNDVATALSPNFTMSGDAAVAKVLPTTERMQTQVLRALGLSLAVGLPTTSRTSSTTVSSALDTKGATDATGVSTTTSTSDIANNGSTTNLLNPGTAPAAPSGIPAGGAAPAVMANSGNLDIDPVLQYKAANYLQQSVQLLNNEIQKVAQRTCYIPYVVKLKLAVMPYRPNMGYDLHARMSFFRDDAALSTNAVVPLTSYALGDGCKYTSLVPVVVPLLAADDLQMAANARSIEEAQQIGLALSAMINGVGGNAGFNKANQKMQAILNNQLSSSLTVSLVNENTLYVRVAASNAASGQPTLTGQTYDVAVLVLVPRTYFADTGPVTMNIDTYSEFRNSNTGDILAPTTDRSIIDRMDRTMRLFLARSDPARFARWGTLSDGQKICVAQALSARIQNSDFDGFRASMATPLDKCEAPKGAKFIDFGMNSDAISGRVFWTAMSALLADNSIKTSRLELPGAAQVNIPYQEALIIDDGSSNATVVLQGIVGYRPGSLIAHLDLPKPGAPKGSKMAIDYINIPPSSINYSPLAQTLTLTFPSLKKLGLSVGSPNDVLVFAPMPCDPATLCPRLNGEKAGGNSYGLGVKYAALSSASNTPAAFSLTSLSPTIVVKREATGYAQVKLSKLPKGETAVVNPSVGASSVIDPTGTVVPLSDDGYVLKQNGVYIFNFGNLSAPGAVVFPAQEMKGTVKLGTANLTIPLSN